jgi:hypothetical protein
MLLEDLKYLIRHIINEEPQFHLTRPVQKLIDDINRDPEIRDEINQAQDQDEIEDLLKYFYVSDEFDENVIEAAAEVISVSQRIGKNLINEAVEEEKGYKGPKKYKKVVGTGKKKRTVRYGAKGYSIAPGTSKGDSYCARSWGQMKDHPSAAKDPNSPLRLSRKKWRCSKDKSRKK